MAKRTDPVESIVEDALDAAGIRHDVSHLDFFLPDYGVYVECKQFFTLRVVEQMVQASDVIVIQGRSAAISFAHMITKKDG